MDVEQLEWLRHILLKLELDQLIGKLLESFDAARRAGTLSRVDEIFVKRGRGIRRKIV